MKAPRIPSTEILDTAIAWLRSNEGGEGESGRCRQAADYLEAIERDRIVKNAARVLGVPVSAARKRIAERMK